MNLILLISVILFLLIIFQLYRSSELLAITNNEKKITYSEEYHGHGLREQAKEMQNCIINNNIESKKMSHSDSIDVMKIMDEVRIKIGLKY